MSDLTITKFSKDLQDRLNRRAARKGRSAQAEAREILREAVKDEPKAVNGAKRKSSDNLNAYESIRAILGPDGGFVLDIPPRHPEREPQGSLDKSESIS